MENFIMNTVFRTMLLAGAAVSLAACACPKKDDYRAIPYEAERTAGNGTVVYEGDCHSGGDRSSYAIEDEKTAGQGDDMFDGMMRK